LSKANKIPLTFIGIATSIAKFIVVNDVIAANVTIFLNRCLQANVMKNSYNGGINAKIEYRGAWNWILFAVRNKHSMTVNKLKKIDRNRV